MWGERMHIKHGAAEHCVKSSPGYSDQLHLDSSLPKITDTTHTLKMLQQFLPCFFCHPTLALYYCVCLLYNCWSPQEVFPHTRKQGARCSPMPTNCLLTSGRHTLPFGRAYHKHPISPTNHSTEIQINPRLEATFICSSICILCKWSKPHLEGFLCSSNTKQLTFAFIITIIIIYYLIIIYCLWGLAIVLQIS